MIRHSTAKGPLRHGIDRTVISLWLGHDSLESAQMYIHADLELKQKALDCVSPSRVRRTRYQITCSRS